jgi:hypothetical protein
MSSKYYQKKRKGVNTTKIHETPYIVGKKRKEKHV